MIQLWLQDFTEGQRKMKIDVGMYPMDEDARPTDVEIMMRIRMERDFFLQQSDWTQMSDSPLSSEKKQEWFVYRQELRDLPASIEVDLIVDFPDSPS